MVAPLTGTVWASLPATASGFRRARCPGVPLVGSPAVTPYFDPVWGFNQLQVWAIGSDGNLYNEWYNGVWNPWSGFSNPGVPLSSGTSPSGSAWGRTWVERA